ncbi:MAG: hypothetical protein PHH85_10475 [Candidatus Methanoperedens sp.]|nr:hypothetical protein [Candidatus Methanoperedens sp.]
MKLFVSKLSIENSGNPKGKKIYIRPCEFYKKYDEEDDKKDENMDIIEEPEDDDDDLKPLNMKILVKEFRDGRLRQGWGNKNGVYSTDLRDGVGSKRDKNGRIQPTKKWVCDFMNLYDASQEEAIGRFRIISKLIEMKEEDIIFVPNVRSVDKFSVATVDEKGYEFSQIKGYYGFGHIIHVKDVKEYDYGEDTLPKIIWSFPPAVVRIRKDEKFKRFLQNTYFK